MNGPVAIAAGGTGGHVFPALALARALLADGLEPAFVGDRRGLALGGDLESVSCHAVRAGQIAGRGPVGAARGAAEMAVGFAQARRLFRRLAPAVAVGFGGYASLPPMAAASSLRIPAVVHESNAVLGRANRLLARRAAAVATGFAGACPSGVHTGSPVRDEFVTARARPYEAPRGSGPIRLLAVGGSQGARVLGRVLPRALAMLPSGLRRRLRVDQQCRAEDIDDARALYERAGIDADVRTFRDDIAERLAAAQLAVARAGASTVAEFAAVGRPALLIPYPHAADDHQSANARVVAAAGAGWLAAEAALDAVGLRDRIAALLGAPGKLARAAAAAREMGRPDAARRLVALIRGVSREAGR